MHTVVTGLGYGDEGKGSIVDGLCSQADIAAVVRYNGGAQAGHRVVMADGRDHVFAQWGSGTFRGVPTFHSEYMALDPAAMAKEAEHLIQQGLARPFDLITVDPDCLIVTPYHKSRNRFVERMREQQGGRHGSCGMGHGIAVGDSIRHPDTAIHVKDIVDGTAEQKLELQRLRYEDFYDGYDTMQEMLDYYAVWIEHVAVAEPDHLKQLATTGELVFEGAQGVLLDEWYGFHPYTTWSTTTFYNAKALLQRAGVRFADVTKLGVLRALSTRHGPGPFLSEEDRWLPLKHEHNTTGEWQGHFRLGNFDAVASRYACAVAKPDAIALTHLDNAENLMNYVSYYWPQGEPMLTDLVPPPDATDLDERTRQTDRLLRSTPVYVVPREAGWTETVERLLGVPVIRESWGPTAEDQRASETAVTRP